MTITNEAAFEESLNRFLAFKQSGKLEKDERAYKLRLIDILGRALSDDALASGEFIPRLKHALQEVTTALINLTHFTVVDDFKKYIEEVPSDRLIRILRGLFDTSLDLAMRFDAFDREMKADYQVYVKRRASSGWLTVVLLTARNSEECIFYRPSLVKFARDVWGAAIDESGTRGERFVAYLKFAHELKQRLAALVGTADLIDAQSFLWTESRRTHREAWKLALSEWLRTRPKTIPPEMSELRDAFTRRFPKNKIREMQLSDYAQGLESKDTFCYWLEFKTAPLGRIGMGSAKNWKVYWQRDKEQWYVNKAFRNEEEAITQIREGIQELIDRVEQGQFEELDRVGAERLGGSLALRCKPLYLYFPDQFLPVTQPDHLRRFINVFGGIPDGEVLTLNRQLLTLLKGLPDFDGMDTYQMGQFLYHGLDVGHDNKDEATRIWKIAPGPEAVHWDMCRNTGCIAVHWLDDIDFRTFATREETKKALLDANQTTGSVGQIWRFTHTLKEGDIVIANRGRDVAVGIGVIASAYIAPSQKDNPSPHAEYRHVRKVDWKITQEAQLPEKFFWPKTIASVTPEAWATIKDAYLKENPSLSEVFDELESTTNAAAKEATDSNIDGDLAPLLTLSQKTKNIILYGPPGTGKTYLVNKFANHFRKQQTTGGPGEFVRFVTFHQSFAYEDFVEGLRPTVNDEGQIRYEVRHGVLREICARATRAWNKDKDAAPKYLLVIDEINRANIAKVFGELITLIEDDKRLGKANTLQVQLPYSGDEFGVPPNLYIVGTMNTADRSIALLDLALRRRFSFWEVMPDSALINFKVVDLGAVITILNRRICMLLDRDHQIGHSYFCEIKNTSDLHFAWFNRVLPLLQEYFYNASDRLHALLGDDFLEKQNFEKLAPRLSDFVDAESAQYSPRQLSADELVAALNKIIEN